MILSEKAMLLVCGCGASDCPRVARVEEELAKAVDEVKGHRDLLAQAMWDMYEVLGFDTDGDRHPGALIAGMRYAGFAKVMVDAAKEARRDHDEALEYVPLTDPETKR